jgi:hypothetical protein
MSVHTKRVDPGDFRTLETTINLKCIAWFKAPAGAKIKISKWLFSEDEQTLDGSTFKKLILTFGKVQVLVSASTDITYSWDPLSSAPSIVSPPIPF